MMMMTRLSGPNYFHKLVLCQTFKLYISFSCWKRNLEIGLGWCLYLDLFRGWVLKSHCWWRVCLLCTKSELPMKFIRLPYSKYSYSTLCVVVFSSPPFWAVPFLTNQTKFLIYSCVSILTIVVTYHFLYLK